MGDGAKMTMQWFLPALLALSALVAAEPRYSGSTSRPRHFQRGIRTLDDRAPNHFVGPHVCRSRNSTHCCPGWTSRPNSLLCVVPICRPDCGSPEFCIAPNMCRCPGGIEAPSCSPGGGHYPYLPRTRGGCRRICMNGGTCTNGTCACAPGWSGEFCTEPICREPCLHGGRCIAPDRCVCFHGLSGTRCEIDRRTGPCYTDTRGALCTGALEGVVCTKQLCCATVGVAWGHPCERCSDLDCPPGHLRNLATKECQDIDECAAVPGLCSGGKCVNSVGSFSCECPPGQRRHRTSNNCEDIDECEDPDICPNGKCVNTEGDYYCLCNPHFIPSPDKKFCIDGRVGSCFTYMSETGECADRLSVALSNRDCCCGYNMGRAWGDFCTPCPPRGSLEWTHLCGGRHIPPKWHRNNTGGAGGSGGDGGEGFEEYEPPSPNPIAKINECMLRSGICGLGDCVDRDPGYNCNCWAGAEKTEQDGDPICIDIDECALGYCKGGTCTNTPGSFECRCPPGFDPVDNNKRCSDQNECEVTNGAMCTNGLCRTFGNGYECVCNPGFESTETGHACRDIDECRATPGVCRRGRCRNLPGAYDCQCDIGFEFVPGRFCIDIDECADDSVCKGGRCVNAEGSFQCVCEAGYRPTADRGACVDVDECAEQRVCRNGRCTNTPGSFRCDCLAGFTLSADGRTCLDEVQDLCYEKYEEGQCSGPGNTPITRSQCCCSSSKGAHLGWGVSCKPCPVKDSKDYAVLCPDGAGKDNAGADINECTSTPGACQHGTCENLEPGFRCLCDPGFHADADGVCKDIDECDMHQSYCTGGQCRNTMGSFTCVCPPGTRYEPDEQLCRDIDECEEQSNPCDNGRCINTHGSYECECEHGFVLDATAQRCLDNRRGSCWRRLVEGRCEAAAPQLLLRQECCCSVGLAWGSPCEPCDLEHCPCRKGYAKLDGTNCRDVDECTLDVDLCIGGTCINTDGSYRCECPPGLTLDPSGNRCTDSRLEMCYTEYMGGRCSGPLGTSRRAHCCCSVLGRAWGDMRCDSCPKRGTDAFRNLCMVVDGDGQSGSWNRPIGNQTDMNHHRPGDGFEFPGGGGGESIIGGGGGESIIGGGGNGDGGAGAGGDGGVYDPMHPGGNWRPSIVPTEMDVNECSAFPGLCGHGRCKNMPGTFICECFPGYEPDSKNHTCVDVNECEIVAEVCGAGECRNTEGSFFCHCLPGHRADEISKVCVDINECVEDRSLCRGGRCVNTPGSFLCECGPGMELAPNKLSCKDIDECSITSGICSNGACENQMGTYQCVCDEGYAQLMVKSHCEDVDECAEDPTRCQHQCVNTPGSYHCTCREGWQLRADGRTCRDVDECAGGARPCGGGQCRNTPGAYSCSCGHGLLPVDGARPTCRDVDECADIPDLCGAGECQNTIGSFVCRCPDGYSVKPEQGPACTDDDECELGTCDCHPAADCINLPGSFQCRCRDGWRGDGAECEDVDECVTNNGGCHPHATCRNTDGSFVCICDTGYKGDGYSCVDIDECKNDPTLCENGHCTNTAGGYYCDCDVGFTKTPDEKACLDMDECATFDNVCVNGRCVNTYGMFKCICDKGYQPDNVEELMLGFNCTDVDECKSPQSCQYGDCINTQGSYICRCPPNYELVSDGTACFDSRKARCYGKIDTRSGTESCVDADELSEDGTMAACCCSVGAAWGNYCDLCPEPGSEEYKQLCPGGPGYQPVLEPPSYVVTLADVDECAQHPALCAHGTCTNTFGSFVCTCAAGWRLAADERRCDDVDECERPGLCGPGLCRNLPGSYVCLCPEGYVPMPNNKECVDIRQRACYVSWDEATGTCSNAAGAPQTRHTCCCGAAGRAWGEPCERCPEPASRDHVALCGARPGLYVNPLTNQTNGINECDIMPQLCKPGVCHDTPTGFTCGCDHGFEHDNTSHLCRDIDECALGRARCRGLAQCVNVPGGYECRCPPGYRPSPDLDSCEDLDECADDHLCDHGDCRNTLGSYRCECQPGYTLRDNVCRDVDECARPRPMCRNGTCENLPGSYTCHCDDGFKPGPNNDCIDINECREGGMVCRNGRCRNTVGSFRCECASGYTLTGDGRNCRDVDECTELPHPCGTNGSPSCTNTNGGYECSCGEGWRLHGRVCEDRDECKELPYACAGGECHNFNGGYMCDCPSGWRFDKAAAVCVDERTEMCYDEYNSGRCHRARPLRLSRAECCCSEGAAWGTYCERCPLPNSPEFLSVCQGGMGRPNLTQDLNECQVRPDVCRGGRCVNTDGSFRCECPAGYVLDASALACKDADECAADPRICGNGTCTNVDGGYQCTCNLGFTEGPEHTCVDIDECAEGRATCSFRCHNTLGSFRCVCPYGYAVAPDGVHCRDIDECAAEPPPCTHACENTVGSYMCKCPDGYRRNPSVPQDALDACEDIDECAELPEHCSPGVCINVDGGFTCDCDAGFEPSEDGTACIDRRTGMCHRSLVAGRCVPEPWPRVASSTPTLPQHVTKAQCCCTLGAAWGPECEICPAHGTPERLELCTAANLGVPGGGGGDGGVGGNGLQGGSHTVTGGGMLPSGFPDVYGDVDECAAMPGLCAPGRCVNTIGSFRCVCGRGYKAAGDVCADVDECLARPRPCAHTCSNTEGSYECGCRVGYELDDDGAACRDVDECARATHTCQQTCTNTDGSYECSCHDGYEKRGDACVDINECHEEGICPTPGKCVNLLGSYRCVCPRGFRLDAAGQRCVDRDECDDGRCQAPCRNYAGGYRCDCPSGTVRSGTACVPVDGCAGGPCGSAPCFPVGATYRCGCPGGYGWDAMHAVCLQLAGGCATASCVYGCQSLGESFQCGCPAGYRIVGAGHCLSALDAALPPDDIGDAPVFPLRDQYKVGGAGGDLLSNEGCFSCKINGRHRRAPDEGLVFANGTIVVRKRKRRSRRRRSVLEPEAELVVVSATARQTWGRAPLLRLLAARERERARPHYRIAYGDERKDFVLSKRDGAWALRLRRHLRTDARLERQLEIEARFVQAPDSRRRSRRQVDLNVPAPMRLYVTVRIAPTKR